MTHYTTTAHIRPPDAPERIWASPEHDDEGWNYGGFWIASKVAPSVEYVRADIIDALRAERDALREAYHEAMHHLNELTDTARFDRLVTNYAEAAMESVKDRAALKGDGE